MRNFIHAVGYALKKTWLVWLVLATAERAWRFSMTGWVSPESARDISGSEAVFIVYSLVFFLLVFAGVAVTGFYTLVFISERMSTPDNSVVELSD